MFGDLSGRWGGFAEYVCAREEELAPKPAGLTFEEAAAIPQAAMLAVQGLRDEGRIRQGQKLLVNGAGGGVGTFAIQIARLYGAETTGVDSAAKLDMLRSLGYDHVLDYAQEDFTKTGQQYDLILDVKTNRSMLAYLRALEPGGTYVTVGGSTGSARSSRAAGAVGLDGAEEAGTRGRPEAEQGPGLHDRACRGGQGQTRGGWSLHAGPSGGGHAVLR